MKLTIFLPLAAFLSWAIAETTDPTDDASPCLLRCMSEAADVAGCASSVDTECTCPSAAFKDALGSCLQHSCTEDDITAAGELHKERCGTTPAE
ncbi:hypothetical protein N7499_011169 [Penicillium canescens]|uniref:CFEM domain-containing protein n=1 Tax=Penicillium canescens TaxID=5083 RepID=A0AAD6NCM4_PENCN|nr:uncharacterized protein N7446_006427 [Penicillium canescens]KAJ5990621.1 hypothetical protein N7522_010828 [Penicillium canescens]KAJ6051791.1 hypothetical protein N7460_002325 [Penicillium canescens]KAJ6062307.1 hypothetical protein N7446_006427 [Penicillium canescens]KAJ6065554.1 hypothetical protein N7444_001207 [Penicillium canescens]KAJ6069282.1 hypothetical protein N7499_011169 [Penicillium canescens]